MKDILKKIWKGWKAVAKRISIVVNTLILFFLYFTLILTAGLISKLLKWDPLQIKRQDVDTYWKTREPVTCDLERAQRLF